jgi:fumarate reductase subunit D
MKEFRLGVLFVHGIGTQPPRDTLVRWGDVLIKVIGRATEEEPGRTIPIVGQADAGDRSGDKPAEVAVEFRCSDRDQREKWLLAEGWWADSFPAPTYSELVSWSFRALPWAIALHIAQRFWQTNPKASKGAWLWALAKAGTQLLFAMAFAPVLMILLALTLVLGLLPIPQLRSLILTTQTTVVGSVGDSLAFVESPLRAALIRGRILEGLERLKVRCERTVIVAHSQGAAATLDALGGILDHDETGESPAPPPEGPVPDALVTFGSGVNQLVSLKVLSAGRLERNIGTNAASVAVIATLGMIALLVFLFVSIQSERTNIGQLVKALTFLSVLWGGGALVFWGSNQMLNNLTAWEVLGARQEAADKKLKLWASMVIYIAFSALVFYHFKDLLGPIITHLVFLVITLANLGYSLWVILSPTTRTVVTRPVQHPPGLSRWIDVYASADPVPNGPTRIEQTSAEVTSVQVWNRGALLSDHTTYWDNLDGFVLRVARMCAETAESPWQDKLPPATQAGWLDRRAAWRVGLLRWTVCGNRMLWAIVWCLLWTRHEARVPVPFSFPSWFRDWGPPVARFATLTALVLLAWWAAAALLRWRWRVWVRAEQEAVLAHKTPGVVISPGQLFGGLGIVISLLGALAFALALGCESQASTLLANPELLLASIPIAGTGVIISWIAYRALPGPQPPCVEGESVGLPGPHPRISSQGSVPPRSKA